jgi:hypothetical protein
MVADGTVFDKGIRLGKRHLDVADRFRDLCVELFGIHVGCDDTPTCRLYTVHSVILVDWLRLVGGMDPNAKMVPGAILASSLAVQAAFLKGLFEDGTVNLKGDKLDHIEWSSCFPELARIVQIMLLRFGIISVRCRRDEQWVIYIYGENAHRFREAIGFVSQWKQDRLQRSVGQETRYSAPFSVTEITAFREFLRNASAHKSIYNNLQTRRTMSRWKMHQFLQEQPSLALRKLLEEKLRWHHDEIVSIDRIEDAPSMCVEVPDGHRFLQNGSPQSNSQGSEYRRVSIFLAAEDLANPHFTKDTVLPNGKLWSFANRWAYTAITRAKSKVSIIIGS